MPESNVVQAMFPVGSRPIPNPQGSAPGIDMRIARPGGGGCRILALPGVPAEMREMWQATLAGELAAVAGRRMIRHHRIKCFGVGESDLEQMLPDIIRRGRVPSVGITVSGATITLRITAEGNTPEECLTGMGPTIETIQQCLGTLVFGQEDDELEHAVGRTLAARGQTLATAEWGTGGLIAHRLVEALEARASYLGGFVSVSAAALAGFTGISAEAIAEHGPVSGDAVHAMAVACRRHTGADFGLAVSEFPEHDPAAQQPKPVYYALASSEGVIVKSSPFAGHSAILKTLSAKRALNLLRLELLRDSPAEQGGPHRAPTL
jgi:nicotinamide-nucleotide amidase